MKQQFSNSGALPNILYGFISSILSALIIALLRLLHDSFSSAFLGIAFCFTVAFFFLLIKLIATKKAYVKMMSNHMEFSQEIQEIYPDKSALMQALTAVLPNARKVDILDLRGFIYTQQDSPLFSILASSWDTDYRILLSDPDSPNTTYRANCMPNKPIKALKSEIKASISVIAGLKRVISGCGRIVSTMCLDSFS